MREKKRDEAACVRVCVYECAREREERCLLVFVKCIKKVLAHKHARAHAQRERERERDEKCLLVFVKWIKKNFHNTHTHGERERERESICACFFIYKHILVKDLKILSSFFFLNRLQIKILPNLIPLLI